MRDGTLVRVVKFDDSLKQFVGLRVLNKYMNDFTDFCDSVKDVLEEHDLVVEIEKGEDGGKGYYVDSEVFHFFDSEDNYLGDIEVVVIINAETCVSEFKKRLHVPLA